MRIHMCAYTYLEKEMAPKYCFILAALIFGQTSFTFQPLELIVVIMGQQESFPVLGCIVFGDS